MVSLPRPTVRDGRPATIEPTLPRGSRLVLHQSAADLAEEFVQFLRALKNNDNQAVAKHGANVIGLYVYWAWRTTKSCWPRSSRKPTETTRSSFSRALSETVSGRARHGAGHRRYPWRCRRECPANHRAIHAPKKLRADSSCGTERTLLVDGRNVVWFPLAHPAAPSAYQNAPVR